MAIIVHLAIILRPLLHRGSYVVAIITVAVVNVAFLYRGYCVVAVIIVAIIHLAIMLSPLLLWFLFMWLLCFGRYFCGYYAVAVITVAITRVDIMAHFVFVWNLTAQPRKLLTRCPTNNVVVFYVDFIREFYVHST